jgi:hypothetical protein
MLYTTTKFEAKNSQSSLLLNKDPNTKATGLSWVLEGQHIDIV